VDGNTTASVSGRYQTYVPSIKHATTSVTFGTTTVTIGCPGRWVPGNITGGGGAAVLELVVNGACVVGGLYVSKPSNPYLCVTGTASAVSGNGPWSWDCNGSGSGHINAINCTAGYQNPLNGSLTCNLSTASSTVNINANTVWTVVANPVCPACSGVRWTINDSNGTSSPSEIGYTLNNIFTTTGLKTVTAELASSTLGVYGPPCSATTTVEQVSGIQEN
jgi:hypothetical protein